MNIMKAEEHHEEAKKPGSYDISHSSFQQLMAAIIAYGSSNRTSRSDKPLSARTIPSDPDHGCQCCIARGHEELYTPENQTTAGEHLGEAKKGSGYGISQPSSEQLTASGMAKASVLPSVRDPIPSDLGHDCQCCIALGREQLFTPKKDTTVQEHPKEAKEGGGFDICQPSLPQVVPSDMANASILPTVSDPPPSDLGHDCECCIALGREQLYTPK
ncbi:uncharacterized protein [Eleutherodactylus coqui]|uniref:uncharacterized protein n=1 Tax=Eleutherodactylus coqui TaxID=57060 RepID=UPI0034624746